jgi:HK97 family phage prohead protease
MNKNQEQRGANTAVERRYAEHGGEVRARAESRAVEGYAAMYGVRADLGWFTEEIAAGAFDEADTAEVVALFNHDPNYPLARNSAGTLQIELDAKGLLYRFDAPNSPMGENLLESLKRGDIKQSSFGFTVKDDKWEMRDGREHRTILKVGSLFDVSPVTFPAYPDTTVAKRSKENATAPTQRHKETALEDQQAAQTEQDTNTLHLLDMELRLLEMES